MAGNEKIEVEAQDPPDYIPRLKRADLVRLIQQSEGQQECCGTPVNEKCQQVDCIWQEVCKNPEEA